LTIRPPHRADRRVPTRCWDWLRRLQPVDPERPDTAVLVAVVPAPGVIRPSWRSEGLAVRGHPHPTKRRHRLCGPGRIPTAGAVAPGRRSGLGSVVAGTAALLVAYSPGEMARPHRPDRRSVAPARRRSGPGSRSACRSCDFIPGCDPPRSSGRGEEGVSCQGPFPSATARRTVARWSTSPSLSVLRA
jgi:hypothetical protein